MTVSVEEMIDRMPRLTAVMGEPWLRQNRDWFEAEDMPLPIWYEQLDRDLAVLESLVGRQKLVECYRSLLRDQTQLLNGIYEVHGAALLASTAIRVDLHVPKGGGSRRNFDVQADIRGHVVNADCKTRKDDIFMRPPGPDAPEGATWRFRMRETVDPHDARELGFPVSRPTPGAHYKEIPESTVVRQDLLDALAQLPERGCNLVIYGQIEGDRSHLERALYGTEMAELIRNMESKEVTARWSRTPTGAFREDEKGEAFRPLSGVLWMRLWQLGLKLGRAYKLYSNPDALVPLSQDAIDAIEDTTNLCATPTEDFESA